MQAKLPNVYEFNIMHGWAEQINLIVCTCDRTTHTFTNMLEYALLAQIPLFQPSLMTYALHGLPASCFYKWYITVQL